MTNDEKNVLLGNLIKIESGMARIYNRFSIKKSFSKPVQQFWRSIALEEELHADIIDELRQAMNKDNLPVIININIDDLKAFVSEINILIKESARADFSDSNAYSLGAKIEMGFNEAGFIDMINTSDQKFITLLKRIQNDTKKHRVMMVNYSRGIS